MKHGAPVVEVLRLGRAVEPWSLRLLNDGSNAFFHLPFAIADVSSAEKHH